MQNPTNPTIKKGLLSEDIFTHSDIEEALSEVVFITEFEFDKLFEDIEFISFDLEEALNDFDLSFLDIDFTFDLEYISFDLEDILFE